MADSPSSNFPVLPPAINLPSVHHQRGHYDLSKKVGLGPQSPIDLLRRMSHDASDPMVDPQTAFPTLGLSGNIISATFCIPLSLGFRRGAGWVSGGICLRFMHDYTLTLETIGAATSSRHIRPLRGVLLSLLSGLNMESYVDRMDR